MGSNASSCPQIINDTDFEIVVFEERGVLYSKQVLKPKEAVDITYGQTGAFPYSIHAIIGDESCIPDDWASLRHFMSASTIPIAVIGALTTRILSGNVPSAISIMGDIAAGTVETSTAETKAAAVWAQELYAKYPERFGTAKPHYFPGERYVAVRGGVLTDLELVDISREEAASIVTVIKPIL